MKKKCNFNSNSEPVMVDFKSKSSFDWRPLGILILGCLAIAFLVYSYIQNMHTLASTTYSEVTIYRDNIPLALKIEGKTGNRLFDFENYGASVEGLVREVAEGFTCEEIINNPQKIASEVKKRFDKTNTSIETLAITVTPPAEFTEAGKNLKATALITKKDSLITASAKHDAIAYTPEAERLEERRDARLNTQEDRKIKLREIESNEKIKFRQAEAIEKAAGKMKRKSGNLTIELH